MSSTKKTLGKDPSEQVATPVIQLVELAKFIHKLAHRVRKGRLVKGEDLIVRARRLRIPIPKTLKDARVTFETKVRFDPAQAIAMEIPVEEPAMNLPGTNLHPQLCARAWIPWGPGGNGFWVKLCLDCPTVQTRLGTFYWPPCVALLQ
jgi:hypothetical protein